jgi:hypothetical protein
MIKFGRFFFFEKKMQNKKRKKEHHILKLNDGGFFPSIVEFDNVVLLRRHCGAHLK